MVTQDKTMYIEVYSILGLLGKEYINKIPKSLYSIIETKASNIKELKYKSLKEINKDNIQKQSLAMIALIHSNYWCESKEEKDELNQIFVSNSIKNEREKREKYNPNNLFKESLNEEEKKEEAIVVYKKPLWKRIISKIKNFICGYN